MGRNKKETILKMEQHKIMVAMAKIQSIKILKGKEVIDQMRITEIEWIVLKIGLR